MKLAAFDLEIAKEIPDGGHWRDASPLGITCAAIATNEADEPRYFQCAPQLSRRESAELVHELQQLVNDGYTLVTWNGTAFDFAILAEESDLPRECAQLALGHVDLMVIVTFKRGHYLGLQKALAGSGLGAKLQEVVLNDGTRLAGMRGSRAPQLWRDGEYTAVLSYLREDVVPLLKLAQQVEQTKQLRWVSSKGNVNVLAVNKLWTVRDCFSFPLPDTSWMTTEPPQRSKFVEWMPPLSNVIPAAKYDTRELRELPLFAYASETPYWREFRAALDES